MVERLSAILSLSTILATVPWARGDVAQQEEVLLNRLDESTRAKVILALSGLVLLGILMMGLTWLTFRMLRKQFRRTDDVIERQKHNRGQDDWARKPLADHGDTNKA